MSEPKEITRRDAAKVAAGATAAAVIVGAPWIQKVKAANSQVQMAIIGVGGVLSGEDAKSKLAAGADLVQLYTGLIYRGPALVAEAVRATRSE